MSNKGTEAVGEGGVYCRSTGNPSIYSIGQGTHKGTR